LKNQNSSTGTGIEIKSAASAGLRLPVLIKSRPQKNSVMTKRVEAATQQTAVNQAEYEVGEAQNPRGRGTG